MKIPTSSQTLVYSKTSLQRGRITARTPRALYFDDDVYIGYCHDGDVLELSVADPVLGAVFYSLDQVETPKPRIERHTDRCLICHASSRTNDIPGHIVRSLFVDVSGQPLLGEGSKDVDHTTPIEDRWGGWYVTGKHGAQRHLGNLIVRDPRARGPFNNDAGQNVTDLTERFRTENYLTPHSDIVALMVLEHQTRVHNLITEANYTARQALRQERDINRALGEPLDQRRETTTSRLDGASQRLLEGLLFAREAPLTSPMLGTTKFAAEFTALGPRDKRGRSLRDFDLRTRMFKHPCSYLIGSTAFAALPPEIQSLVMTKLRAVLENRDANETFAHLPPADRQAIREILNETLPNLWALGDPARPAVKP